MPKGKTKRWAKIALAGLALAGIGLAFAPQGAQAGGFGVSVRVGGYGGHYSSGYGYYDNCAPRYERHCHERPVVRYYSQERYCEPTVRYYEHRHRHYDSHRHYRSYRSRYDRCR